MEDVVNLSDYFKFLFALALVIGLILLLAFLLRRFGANLPAALNKGRRLNIVESLAIDAKHRLILVRRDDTEHLVILGQTSEVVIEKNITPPPDAKAEAVKIKISPPNPRKDKSPGNRFRDLLANMKSNQK